MQTVHRAPRAASHLREWFCVVAVASSILLAGCRGCDDDNKSRLDAGVPPDAGSGSAASIPAPALDPGLATSFADATQFLYTGDHPVQTGVAPGVLDPARVVVLRGKVVTRDGAPLAGVIITLRDHPEFGQTLTRSDGMFDIAANGGGLVSVQYTSSGRLPAQRRVQTPVQDYVYLPDVVLVSRDSAVTSVAMGLDSMQVARGTVQSDGDGSRRATILVPAGTTASLVQPDGSLLPAPKLGIRLTEYTVGANGPAAMPGSLPATSAYTYAVELGVDEAVAKVDGRDVVFNQPVVFYVENFVGIPVGEVVPVGYYDPARSTWLGAPNGRVIKILSAAGDLDVTGDDVADSGTALSDLGITDTERAQLGSLYSVGQTLWRTPLQHFSTVDCNWSVVCTGECSAPHAPPPQTSPACQSTQDGSIIGCDRQTLGEDVELAGSPFSLHYESDRVAGRTAEVSLALSLGSGRVPDGVQGTEVEVLVAGQKLTQSVSATTMSVTVAWDGKDGYGRTVAGSQPFTLRVGYRYRVVYAKGAAAAVSWAALSGIPMGGSRARMELTLFQEWHGLIRRWNNGAQGLGAWSLSNVHAYDPIGRVLHLGDGTQRDTESLGANVIETFAGSQSGFSGDGGPATAARLLFPAGLALGADGSLYIADGGNLRIRRVAPDGTLSTFAGRTRTTVGHDGDGGPATLASFEDVTAVAVGPDGSVYISDGRARLVRRVTPDGIIHAFAGSGASRYSGDGGPASNAGMAPWGLAVSPDGSVYIADVDNHRIRVVDPNGIITTLAGTGVSGFAGDGGPANLARLSGPRGLALGPDGSVIFVDHTNIRIRRISPQGIISTVAGNGLPGFAGDGGEAVAAKLQDPYDVAVAPDGTLYIADAVSNRIRAVGSEGIISTVAGTGVEGLSGDGGLAPNARLDWPEAVTVASDGTIYLAEHFNHRVRRLRAARPGGLVTEIVVPSSDAREVYVFSKAGRHLRTLDGLTGAVRAVFTYGPSGLLSIDDGDGNITTVERDATTGVPTAIVAPHGQRTALQVDAHGFLSRIEDPSGAAVALVTGSTGLLTSLIDRRGGVHRFDYDTVGRLVRDENPAGGVQVLSRADTANGTTVTVTTKLGRVSSYQLEHLSSGVQRRVTIDPSGAITRSVLGTDGSLTVTSPDGTVDVQVPGPDPRFGMLAPILASSTRTTPGGLVHTVTRTRTATRTAAGNPFDVDTLTETENVDGRISTAVYVNSSRTLTVTSPAGRVATITLDARGRVASEHVDGQQPFTYVYDLRGRLVQFAQGPRAMTVVWGSNDGYLETLRDPLGRTTQFQNDPIGHPTKMTRPDGKFVQLGYDAAGDVTQLTPPEQSAHRFGYTAMSLLESYQPPSLPGVGNDSYAYDFDGALQLVTYPDGTSSRYTRDAAGRPTQLAVPWGNYDLTYDAFGHVKSAAYQGQSLQWSYDGFLPAEEILTGPVSGTVGYTYDNRFRIASIAVNDTSVAYAYDDDGLPTQAGPLALARSTATGQLTAATLGVVASTWSYDSFGAIETATAKVSGTTVFQETLTRDALARITGKVETVQGAVTTWAYDYDIAGRLQRVTKDGATSGAYRFDANGNRTSANGTVAAFDAQDRLLSAGALQFKYDAFGSLIEKRDTATTPNKVTQYQYDGNGGLRKVTLSDGAVLDYLIDARGRRVGKKRNGVLEKGWLYDGQLRVVAELDGAGAVTSRFIYGALIHSPDYLVRDGVVYRFVHDSLGGVRLVINSVTGTVAQRMDYDAFGNVTVDTSPGFQPFGFAGGLYDRDTELVRFGARDFDSRVGRWTTKDLMLFAGGDTNVYAYVGNDPVNRRDPGGLDPSSNLLPNGPGPSVQQFLPNQPSQFDRKQPKDETPACTPPTLNDRIKRGLSRINNFISNPPTPNWVNQKVLDHALDFAREQKKTVTPFEKMINESNRPDVHGIPISGTF